MEIISSPELLAHTPTLRAALSPKHSGPRKSAALRTATSVAATILLSAGALTCQQALADDQSQGAITGATATAPDKKKEESVEEVIVTGSLIPQSQVENANPVVVISSEDLQNRGFQTVADALQQSSFATGSIDSGQHVNGFTPGAKVVSLFGLDPGYTKFLIDGLPIADYPALYGGTDLVTSISGIPMDLVERIDILPGGQSSIYGSDAIAGVINIILKKELDGPFVDVRYGFTKDGGGTDRVIATGDSFKFGSFNLMVSGQYEETDPIWGFQRPLTNQYFANGTSPQVAERDFLIYGLSDNYYFEDPANCANVSGLVNGTEKEQFRAGHGNYCGTDSQGDYTIGDGDQSGQIYVRLTDDVTDNLQLYANVLWDHDVASYSIGPYFYSTGDAYSQGNYTWGYYEDPNITGTGFNAGDLLNLQRSFTPQETGGLDNTLSYATTNSIRLNGGLKGLLFGTKWNYDLGMLFTDDRLDEAEHQLSMAGLNSYFGSILGTPTYDPIVGTNIFTPNYALFYSPITPQQYESYSTYSHAFSYSEDSTLRGQLTNSALFNLPGGPAGIALVAETGDQEWTNNPDPGINEELYFGPYTATDSTGHRSRWAGTGELRLPLLKSLIVDASARYDAYHVEGFSFDKTTYDVSIEYRPLEQLLIRGRYGTAFKAPSLADEFQGVQGLGTSVPDYYLCAKAGFPPSNVSNCPTNLSDSQVELLTSGNTTLKPITATVWSYGVVWSPVDRLSLKADYLHWGISNEVTEQSDNLVMLEDYECEFGILNITSALCQHVLQQVVRNPVSDQLISISTPKINVSQENVNSVVAGFNYQWRAGVIGNFTLEGSWTDMIYHAFRIYAGDPLDNLLTDPINSQEFKSKINGSLTWAKDALQATVYVNRVGGTPNYVAIEDGYGVPGAGTLGVWTLTSLSARYQVTHQFEVSFAVDNLFNTMPPKDDTYPGSAGSNEGTFGTPTGPAYNIFQYNNFGRSYLLEANYHFTR
jgi:iron complex outermembrane recepter protein